MGRKKKRVSHKEEHKSLLVIYALILITLTIIGSQQFGIVGVYLTRIVRFTVGDSYQLFYVLMFMYSLFLLFWRKHPILRTKTMVSLALMMTATILFTAINVIKPDVIGFAAMNTWLKDYDLIFKGALTAGGGLIGVFLYSVFSILFARQGTWIVVFVMLMIGLILFIDFRYVREQLAKLKKTKNKVMSEIQDDFSDYGEKPIKPVNKRHSLFMTPDEPAMDVVAKTQPLVKNQNDERDIKTTSAATVSSVGNYSLPSIALLDEIVVKGKSAANSSAAGIKGKKLIEILGEFGINASLVGTHIGPAVTKFEVRPDSNVKISKIASIQDNIKMELAAKELRIEAPIPGRNAVGVEIPNVEMIPVRLLEMIKEIPADKASKKLLFALGRDLMGKAVYAELDKMPHLLIAGATGSGKSVCVNSIISTLLLRTSPDEVKMLLIDPKKVEFTAYHKIPHLIGPVISDAAEAARALKVIVMMMENRYEVFSKVGVRNITAYNELLIKAPEQHLQPMPWIVVIIDELADLMMVAGKEVEASIQRITQLARAAGIHLIVATQRPSVDVITGIIKANIPSRLAFAVSSGIDSRTILDHVGAERLLGYGDMLFIPVGDPSPTRIQGVFVSDDEVRRLSEMVSAQRKPHYDDAFIRLEALDSGSDGGLLSVSDDPMFEEVKDYVIETQRASTSSIQRRFGLGYNRAARMVDVLEQKGIIGPAQGSKPRDVFAKKPENEDE